MASTATAAATMLRESSFGVVVSPPSLSDMRSSDLALGVLRPYPEILVVLLGEGNDDAELMAHAKKHRFVRMPASTSGAEVARYVAMRLRPAPADVTIGPKGTHQPS